MLFFIFSEKTSFNITLMLQQQVFSISNIQNI